MPGKVLTPVSYYCQYTMSNSTPFNVADQRGTAETATRVTDTQEQHPALNIGGRCLTDTLERLESGHRGKPMPHASLEGIVEQARDLLGDIVLAYAAKVARGEVGAGGTAPVRVRHELTMASARQGLMYGLIQSGKTAAMIVTAAMAIDNGFRVIIVLTSNNVNLVKQTAGRFEALEGPLVYSSNTSAGDEYEWEADRGNIERHIGSHGVVFVCAKQSDHQRALITFLREVGAADFPTIIFDDEADQATPDTTMARRSAGQPNAPLHGSTTYRLTVENDAIAEAGESIREVLRHNVFVQVTATPYGLLLQGFGSPLRPEFYRLIKSLATAMKAAKHSSTASINGVTAKAEPPLVYIKNTRGANP